MFVAERADLLGVLDGIVRPRNDGDAGVGHDRPSLRLLAQPLHRVAGGTDPGDPLSGLDAPGERGVLREEAVSGMDRVRTGSFRRLDDRFAVEIGVGGRCGADVVRLVGVLDVARVAVGVAIDRDRLDAELFAGGHHADRDLAPVRDE